MRGCEADRSQKKQQQQRLKTMTQSIRLWELSGEIQQLGAELARVT